MKRTVASFVLLAAIAGTSCDRAKSKFDQAPTISTHAAEQNAHTPTAAAQAGAPKDVEGRLARLERRQDKIIAILEGALPPNEPDPSAVYSVPVSGNDPVEGPADAKVTIIEGFEFKCPYCAIAAPTVEQIIAKYPKDVRVVSKYLLIHGPSAMPSAVAACAAGKQGKYSEMKKMLWESIFKMENGRPMMQEPATTAEAVKALAQSLKLDMAKYESDITSADCVSWPKTSQATLSPVGVSGTPAFIINGRIVSGAVPFDALDKIITEEIAKADKAIADGTPAKDYYQTIVNKGEKRVKGRFEE